MAHAAANGARAPLLGGIGSRVAALSRAPYQTHSQAISDPVCESSEPTSQSGILTKNGKQSRKNTNKGWQQFNQSRPPRKGLVSRRTPWSWSRTSSFIGYHLNDVNLLLFMAIAKQAVPSSAMSRAGDLENLPYLRISKASDPPAHSALGGHTSCSSSPV
jgi:hypothetical protein